MQNDTEFLGVESWHERKPARLAVVAPSTMGSCKPRAKVIGMPTADAFDTARGICLGGGLGFVLWVVVGLLVWVVLS